MYLIVLLLITFFKHNQLSPVPFITHYKDPFLNELLDSYNTLNSINNYADPQTLIDSKVQLSSAEPLNDGDFERAKNLAESDIFGNETTLYQANFYEGDIVPSLQSRNAMADMSQRWPENRIPYTISKEFNQKERSIIARAMQTYHNNTCVRFEAKNSKDGDYLFIYPGLGCASLVGRMKKMQPVLLGKGCVFSGIVEHELMHAVGFWHEQSRADRDEFVKINWQNIQKGMAYNFAKLSGKEVQHLGEEYDYSSVMHYGTHAFAKGSAPTITPLKSGVVIGQRKGLSSIDIAKINKLYDCPTRRSNKKSSKLRLRFKTGR